MYQYRIHVRAFNVSLIFYRIQISLAICQLEINENIHATLITIDQLQNASFRYKLTRAIDLLNLESVCTVHLFVELSQSNPTYHLNTRRVLTSVDSSTSGTRTR